MTGLPSNEGPRLAARALIVEDERLLIVNAYPDDVSDLWCAPGGGVEKHCSIPDNLRREVFEETGLSIHVGGLVGINEFHDPASGFHQVELFFRARIVSGSLQENWQDVDGIVTQRRFASREELAKLRFKPDSLIAYAFSDCEIACDALELLVR